MAGRFDAREMDVDGKGPASRRIALRWGRPIAVESRANQKLRCSRVRQSRRVLTAEDVHQVSAITRYVPF